MRFKAIEIVVAVLLAVGICVGVLSIAAKQKTKTVTRTVVKTKVVHPHFSGPQSMAGFLGVDGSQAKCPANFISEAVCFQFQGNRLFAFLGFVP